MPIQKWVIIYCAVAALIIGAGGLFCFYCVKDFIKTNNLWIKILLVPLGLAALFVTVGLAAFAVMFYPEMHDPFGDARFDRAVWLSASSSMDSHNPRGPMAHDLMHNFLHKGMSKTEVRKLLGPPQNRKWDGELHVDTYYIGHWDPTTDWGGDRLVVRYSVSDRLGSTDLYPPSEEYSQLMKYRHTHSQCLKSRTILRAVPNMQRSRSY
jgi:hypothetical protein